MPALRRLALAPVALTLAACASSAAPTPIPPGALPTASPVATATASPAPSPTPAATPAATTGFVFAAEQVVAYYVEGAGFACDEWSPADVEDHRQRACTLADPKDPVADQVVVVTVDPVGGLADVVAIYERTDGSPADKGSAMRFFATVIGATFGGEDGPDAARWLVEHLGAATASMQLRGLTFGTFLPDPEPGSTDASQFVIEIATPTFRAAT